MNSKYMLICTITLLLSFSTAWTQDSEEEAEATIRLMGAAEAELPDAVTREIVLPAHLLEASEEDQAAAVEHAAKAVKKGGR